MSQYPNSSVRSEKWLKPGLVTLTAFFHPCADGDQDEDYHTDLERMWRGCMEQKTTLVCFREGSDEIIGLNVMIFSIKSDTFMQELEAQSKSKGFRSVCKIMDICYERFSPYEKYNVDRYISSLGLTVERKYRGIALGTRMLQAR